jgi:peptidoglycan hydrolase-like protein with peptidoglycan-binding domain
MAIPESVGRGLKDFMLLRSKLLKDDAKLQACLVNDSAHVTQGAVGDHVARIQAALAILDDLQIDAGEILTNKYGASTAAAVLRFKRKRAIINRSYQTQADNIVGKITIGVLDAELLQHEKETRTIVKEIRCEFGQGPGKQA